MSFLDKMKQAKDLYGNMKKVQAEIAKIKCEGKSKNAEVKVVVDGNHIMLNLLIDSSLKNDQFLSNLIIEACNDAHSKVDKEIKSRMGNMIGAGGMKLPF
tara:strand:+ start:581 stop:880 length:300 start_codon:yes stop_codon:yes gene_type:complete